MRVTAPAARASAPRSVAVVFNFCVAVTGAGLDTVRVVHNQVVDVVVEIRVSLPVVTTVAVLLIQIFVCTEPRCGEYDDSKLVRRVETVHRGVRPLLGTPRCKLGAVRVEMLMVA